MLSVHCVLVRSSAVTALSQQHLCSSNQLNVINKSMLIRKRTLYCGNKLRENRPLCLSVSQCICVPLFSSLYIVSAGWRSATQVVASHYHHQRLSQCTIFFFSSLLFAASINPFIYLAKNNNNNNIRFFSSTFLPFFCCSHHQTSKLKLTVQE